MKKSFIFIILLLASATISLYAQLQAGGLYIKSGTLFSTDGLTMIPSADVVLANHTITRSAGVITWPYFNSIRRHYSASPPFNYQGRIGLFYLNAELNDNVNTELQLAYSSAIGSSNPADYTITTGSAVDINTRYVAQVFGSALNLAGITAVSPNTSLLANNILSPNGDGFNDVWEIRNIHKYPDNEIKIFDRAGKLVFTQKGYNNTWGGTNLKDKLVIEDYYYYIIDPGPGSGLNKLKGILTVIRDW